MSVTYFTGQNRPPTKKAAWIGILQSQSMDCLFYVKNGVFIAWQYPSDGFYRQYSDFSPTDDGDVVFNFNSRETTA